jgi:hypothetical protein
MANNRLYLVDTATGHWIMIAKSYAEWRSWDGEFAQGVLLDMFLRGHDDAAAQSGTVPTGFVLMTERDDLPECKGDPTVDPLRGWRPKVEAAPR